MRVRIYKDGKPDWTPWEPSGPAHLSNRGGVAIAGGFPLGYGAVGRVIPDHNAARAERRKQVHYGDPNAARTRRNALRGEHMLDRGKTPDKVCTRFGDNRLVKSTRASENQGVQPTKPRRSAP